MPVRKNYDIHAHVRANATDIAELAMYYEELGHKYKTRSLASLLRYAVEDLAELIRRNSDDTRRLHPDDAIETLEIFGLIPRSKEFILGRVKEIKKRDPERLDELAKEKEHYQLLRESLEGNEREGTEKGESNREKILPKYRPESKTNSQIFNGIYTTALKHLENMEPRNWRDKKVEYTPEQLEEIERAKDHGYKYANQETKISTTDSEYNTSFRTSVVNNLGASWIDKWYEKYKDTIDGQWYKETYLDTKKEIG